MAQHEASIGDARSDEVRADDTASEAVQALRRVLANPRRTRR